MPNEISDHGRGAGANPANRFVPLNVVYDAGAGEFADAINPATTFLKDSTRKIIAFNDSPDVGFDASVNPYRGCEHGCIYCFARPTHEYLGFSAGLDFETKILVKENAPGLLRQELAAPRWKPQTLGLSGVTDCYQPVERKLKITRRVLGVLAEFRNPVAVITKNALVCRDIDLLKDLSASRAALVFVSVTTLDRDLARVMEPRTSVPARRLWAIEQLAAAGVPVGVLAAPMIPGLTDHEMPLILKAAANAGATFAGLTPLRLPLAVAELFEAWLARHFPDRKDKVLNRIREMRGGKLNDPNFGSRMRGEGIWADQLRKMFEMGKKSAGITGECPALSTADFKIPLSANTQMTLW